MSEMPPEARPLQGDVLLPEEYLEARRDLWAAHESGQLTADELTEQLTLLTEQNPGMTAAGISNMLDHLQ